VDILYDVEDKKNKYYMPCTQDIGDSCCSAYVIDEKYVTDER